jgi:hypothetical protein
LKTKTNLAKPFPKSFTVSVLPVPAGPYGAPPFLSIIAAVNVM